MNILVFNPGSNSLKLELIHCQPEQRWAFEGSKQFSVSIEGISHEAELSQFDGKKRIASESIEARDFAQAADSFLDWYGKRGTAENSDRSRVDRIDRVAVRVVHGGREFDHPVVIDAAVEKRIIEFEKLAPLHNKSSVEILEPIRKGLPGVPIYAVFDTAFHRTIPEYASQYAIPRDLAERHQIRRYGFHGISHRYLLERYAHLAGKAPGTCNVVSMHLESGCSVTAVREGKSVDNTMGLTPLEGLMMGTRSGDVDPSLVPLLIREEHMSVDEVMRVLNKESGLQGVSGVSLDTRILMKEYDSNPRVKLAMDMFAYRVRKAVGAYLTVLGNVDAVIFGGGIAENTKFVRQYVCDGLRSFGVEMDQEANERLIDVEGRLSVVGSKTEAWVVVTEEGLQIAHECCLA
jgi:acetate kinase